jgi:hypothetical protein
VRGKACPEDAARARAGEVWQRAINCELLSVIAMFSEILGAALPMFSEILQGGKK